MRKLFFSVALLAALPIMAQTVSQQAAPQRDNALTAVLQKAEGNGFRAPSVSQPTRSGIDSPSGIIYKTPEGTEHARQLRSGFGFRNTQSGVEANSYEYAVGRYVEGTDGCLYIYEPFNTLATQSWLKLDKVSDGYYVAHTPQPIYENNGQVYYASWYKMARIDGHTYGYVPDTIAGQVDGDMYFTLQDGVLQMENDDHFEDTRYPAHMLCLTNALDEWIGYGDGFTHIEPIKESIVALPDGVQPQVYSLETTKMNNITQEVETVRQMTRVAINGQDIYLQNPADTLSWIKGAFDGQTATFSPQYAGADVEQCYHLWMKPATYTVVEDEMDGYTFYNRSYADADQLTFRYVADQKKFTTNDECSMLMSVRPGEIYFLRNYDDPVYKEFNETAATPVAPQIHTIWGYAEDTGSGLAQIIVTAKGTKGEPLSTENLYWRMLLNDENTVYPFTSAVYDGLEKDMTDVPYDFADGYYFFSTNDIKAFFYYFDEKQYDRLGFQAVYRGMGEEHKSDITWISTETITGIHSAASETTTAPREYFDLQGRRLQEPLSHGVTIVRQGGKVTKHVAR